MSEKHIHPGCGHKCACSQPNEPNCVMDELARLLSSGQQACRSMWDTRWPSYAGEYRWEGPDTYSITPEETNEPYFQSIED